MKVYTGQTRARKLVKELAARGWGEMLSPPALPPPLHMPYAVDNGAFPLWKAGKPHDPACSWLVETLDYLRVCGFRGGCDFVVCPDIVAGGLESLAFSLEWAERITDFPLYLAVQDGMSAADVIPHLKSFAGIFVGGSLDWKIRTAASWVKVAHSAGLPCHIGRAGDEDSAAWATRIGADSIDSCTPLWGEANLKRFERGLNKKKSKDPQRSLFDE
jgi:hypothetical protein